MAQFVRRFHLPIMATLFLAGAAFLLKMCYLSLAFNTAFGIIYLTAVYVWVRARFGLSMPPLLLGPGNRCVGKFFPRIRQSVWTNAV